MTAPCGSLDHVLSTATTLHPTATSTSNHLSSTRLRISQEERLRVERSENTLGLDIRGPKTLTIATVELEVDRP